MQTEKRLTGYPSTDKPWLKYYAKDVEKTPIPEMSIYQLIKQNNANRLNKVALDLRNSSNNFEKGITITYGKFFKRVEDIAKSYDVLGVKPNEIVITVLPNVPESRMLIYGLNILGATVYPVSPMISAAQLDNIIDTCNAKHIAVFSRFYSKFQSVLENKSLNSILYITGMESAPKLLRMFVGLKGKQAVPTGAMTWKEFDKHKKEYKGRLNPYFDPEHIAVIVGTSGTTGIPKGVCLTDLNLNAIAVQHRVSGCFDDEDTLLDALMQSIGYGISTMHFSTCSGFKNILIPELLTDRFSEVLCKTNPMHFAGGPVHYQNLIKSKEFASGIVPKLNNMISGGASLPKELERKLNHVDDNFAECGKEDARILVRQGFGATENGGCGAYAKKGAYKFGGVGIPLPLDVFAIFEPGTDNELPYHTEGEICISGPTVMKEYLYNPAETENVLKIHKDGKTWLHLADLGYMDEDGHVYITDRIKNIFMRTGFNVHPSKIEEYISTLPYVKECAVIGFEHPEQQKVPVAFLSLSEQSDKIVEDIKKCCYENLEELSVPYEYVIVDSIPRNMGGKVDINLLIKNSNIDYMKVE